MSFKKNMGYARIFVNKTITLSFGRGHVHHTRYRGYNFNQSHSLRPAHEPFQDSSKGANIRVPEPTGHKLPRTSYWVGLLPLRLVLHRDRIVCYQREGRSR